MAQTYWNEDEGRLESPRRRRKPQWFDVIRPYRAESDPLAELAWARVTGIGYRSSRYFRWRQIAMRPVRLPGGAA